MSVVSAHGPDAEDEHILASLDAAFASGTQATREMAAEARRMRLWHWLRGCRLLAAARTADGDLDFAFDTSYLRSKVPDALPRLVVRLHGGDAALRHGDAEGPLDAVPIDFIVRGVGAEGARVVLRPRRRQSGQLVLSFSDWTLLAADGAPMPIETLQRASERYWWS